MGDAGDDTLVGGRGDDRLTGGSNNDELDGKSGNDVLVGGSSTDLLMGGSGNDTLNGGTGKDTLTGGADADVFIFGQGGGTDRVTDFESGLDRMDVSDHGLANLADVLAISTDTSTGLRIQFSASERVLVDGIAKADLTMDDFIFA